MVPGDSSRDDGGANESLLLLELVRQSQEKILLAANSLLFQEGDPCRGAYFVEDGELDLVISSGSKRIQVGTARSGNLLALSSVVSNYDHQCSAIARRDSKMVFLATNVIKDYLREHPETCLLTVQMLGSELLDLSSNIIRPLKLHPRYPKQI